MSLQVPPRAPWSLVYDGPPDVVLGPLPRDYRDIPARVVINLCGVEGAHGDELSALHVWPLLDSQAARYVPPRGEVEAFLARIHPDVSREASYWHCHAGINRSSFILAAYRHVYHGERISEVIHNLRARRHPTVLCNATFERLLREWYGGRDEQDFKPFDYEAWKAEVARHVALYGRDE